MKYAKRYISILILGVFLQLLYVSSSAQEKMYVWRPKDQNITGKHGVFEGTKFNLIVKDKRELSSRTRDKCTSDELINVVENLIRESYPSARFHLVVSGQDAVEKGKITVQIDILAYYATFHSATWHASTEYSVKISDYRHEPMTEQNRDIIKDRSFFNLNGYQTAKSNLNKTFMEANEELISFIYNINNFKN